MIGLEIGLACKISRWIGGEKQNRERAEAATNLVNASTSRARAHMARREAGGSDMLGKPGRPASRRPYHCRIMGVITAYNATWEELLRSSGVLPPFTLERAN